MNNEIGVKWKKYEQQKNTGEKMEFAIINCLYTGAD